LPGAVNTFLNSLAWRNGGEKYNKEKKKCNWK
jgi:hypothetical protein